MEDKFNWHLEVPSLTTNLLTVNGFSVLLSKYEAKIIFKTVRNSLLWHVQSFNVISGYLCEHNLSQVNINNYQSNDLPSIMQSFSTGNSTPFQTVDLLKTHGNTFLFVSNNQNNQKLLHRADVLSHFHSYDVRFRSVLGSVFVCVLWGF